jgi:DNA-binding Lrp family transcriptional regulator
MEAIVWKSTKFIWKLKRIASWVINMPLAFVIVNTVQDKIENVLEKITKVNGVEDAYMLYGVYDIVVKIKADNTEILKKSDSGHPNIGPHIIYTNTPWCTLIMNAHGNNNQ